MITPEYKVLHRNRPKLEDYVKDHMTRIAGQLEAHNILTQHQYEEVTGDPKQGARNLLGIILRSVEEDSDTFTFFLDVIRKVGNAGFQKFATKIEDECKKEYQALFPDVSGKFFLTSLSKFFGMHNYVHSVQHYYTILIIYVKG